ncbi:MAG: PCRF domain-containing protein, partial [candidate division Zixibacteria bacterium]|nr:PCRF domain-containing protein [candidate division Zixibacteria bacterium]NIW39466.1 PCRF domain-containing protein [candidate division Zixibacteria bacterium]
GIESRYQELNQLLMEVGDDYQRATELSIERAELEPLIVKAERYRQVLQQLEEALSLADEEDDEIRQLAAVEIEELETELGNL